MSYAIGIDLGTTFTAAAVCDPGVAPQMLSLGSSGYSVPSVLFLRDDESFLAGEAAELRAAGDPTRVARHFKRRLGDDVPIRLAGTAFDPLSLTRELLDWVLELVTSRRGEAPAVVVLTHPANWGDFRAELLREAATVDGAQTLLISEPAAAASHYVQGERVEPGELIGVYDLGGGTFDAVVMRRTETGFELAGRAGGVERLGGVDFDDAIWSYVLTEAEVELGADDDATMAAAYDLRSNCVAAKRLLSVDTSADIRVPLRAATTSVRLTRAEFERRIRPRLAETIEAFDTVMAGAKVVPADLSRILLVGGASRIPLVGELLASHFGVPIAVDSDPKNAVALGAAGHGAASLAPVSVASSFRAQTRTVSATPESRRPVVPPSPAEPPRPPTDQARPSSPSVDAAASAPSFPPPVVTPGSAPLPPQAAAAPPAPPLPEVRRTPPSPAVPPSPAPSPQRAEPDLSFPAPTSQPVPARVPPRPSSDRLPPPAGAPSHPARPAESAPAVGDDTFAPPPITTSAASRGDTAPSTSSSAPTPEPSELSGVSTESRHRIRTPVSYDAPVVTHFETVPAQAQPVGTSKFVMVALIVALLLVIVVGIVVLQSK